MMRRIWIVFLFFMMGCFFSEVAFAQDYSRIAPSIPESYQGIIREQDPLPLEIEPVDRDVLVGKFNSIVFVDHPDAVIDLVPVTGDHLVVNGLDMLETREFYSAISSYFNQPVTMENLKKIMRYTTEYLRKHDYPVVDVVLPDGQDITDGKVQIVVLIGKYGELEVDGNEWFYEDYYAKHFKLPTGDPISRSELLQKLEWINSNPFNRVDVMYRRGKNFGETDVVLNVKDRNPVRVYSGYDDTGNDLTREERVFAGFNLGNLFGKGHQLNYQFMSSPEFKKMRAHSANYVVPLSWQHRLTMFGSFSETDSEVDAPFELDGQSWQLGLRYGIPLKRFGDYRHALEFGYDYKSTNSSLDFGEVNVFGNDIEVSQFSVGYSADFQDRFGDSHVGSTVYWSPGRMTPHNRDEDFEQDRAGADAEYFYGECELSRLTYLPHDFVWSAAAKGQLSNGNLVGSERMGLGGYSSVRGYDEREVSGDHGFYVRNELRSPGVGFLGGLRECLRDELQFLLFFDYGMVARDEKLASEAGVMHLASIGPGLRYSLNDNFSLRLDYGWQLHDSGAGNKNSRRLHLSAVMSY